MERRSKFNISISQLVIRAKRPSTVSARRYRQAAVDFAALKYSETRAQILEVSTDLSGHAQSAPDRHRRYSSDLNMARGVSQSARCIRKD
jgi:hypothetical protein